LIIIERSWKPAEVPEVPSFLRKQVALLSSRRSICGTMRCQADLSPWESDAACPSGKCFEV